MVKIGKDRDWRTSPYPILIPHPCFQENSSLTPGVHQQLNENFVNDYDCDYDYDFAIRYLLFSREFVINRWFTSGWMKISREDAKLAKFLFFTLRLCAFA